MLKEMMKLGCDIGVKNPFQKMNNFILKKILKRIEKKKSHKKGTKKIKNIFFN
jgi:hypothetical protein